MKRTILFLSIFSIISINCKDNTKSKNANIGKTDSAYGTKTIVSKNTLNIDSTRIDTRKEKPIKILKENYDLNYNWEKIETKITKKEKKELAKKLSVHFDYLFEGKYNEKDFLESLHFTNLNGDSEIDIIFNGWSGGESENLQLFENTKKGFVKWFDCFQFPLDIIIHDDKITNLVTIDDGCCDSYMTIVSNYIIEKRNVLEKERAFIIGTDMNGIDIEPTVFEVINEKYYLRDSPKIKNEMNDNYPRDRKGNIIGELKKGEKGIAYKSQKDETGRIWWLIETEPLDSLNNSIFYDSTEIKTSYIGWISSRYVKIIDN